MSTFSNNSNYIKELYYTASDIEFYATQIMLHYLISADTKKLKKQFEG